MLEKHSKLCNLVFALVIIVANCHIKLINMGIWTFERSRCPPRALFRYNSSENPKYKSPECWKINWYWRLFFMRLSCYWSLIPSVTAVKVAVDPHTTLINTIENCQIDYFRSLTHRINYKFMCLCGYWQQKLANGRGRILAVIVKTLIAIDP